MATAERTSDGAVGGLSSWRDGPGKRAIAEFVARVCGADMLHFTQHQDKPFLRLLVQHDDEEREFAYDTGAEQALDQAAKDGWTVISVKNDWATVF